MELSILKCPEPPLGSIELRDRRSQVNKKRRLLTLLSWVPRYALGRANQLYFAVEMLDSKQMLTGPKIMVAHGFLRRVMSQRS